MIMMRSTLRNRFLQNRSEGNPKLFCKQRNKRILFLQKSKKDYCNLCEENTTDIKK